MVDEPWRSRKLTRREWLLMRAIVEGAPPFLAAEAVASVAIEHPDIDYDNDYRTWEEWEAAQQQP